MIGSGRDTGSSMLLKVPVPLSLAEMKIQPSVERVKVNSLLGSEIDVAWSSSVTRLLRFTSTGDANVNSAALPKAQRINERRPEAMCDTLIGSPPSTGVRDVPAKVPANVYQGWSVIRQRAVGVQVLQSQHLGVSPGDVSEPVNSRQF